MAEKRRDDRMNPTRTEGYTLESVDTQTERAHLRTALPLRVRVRSIERTALIEFTGSDYLTGEAARAVIDELYRQVRDHLHCHLVVGFSDVRHVSGRALSLLARLCMRLKRRGGWVRLWASTRRSAVNSGWPG